MNIALKPLSERELSADEVAVELRAKLRDIPGTGVTIINHRSFAWAHEIRARTISTR